MVIQYTVERPVNSVVNKVHESGFGCLRGYCCRGNLSLADDVDSEGVSRTGKKTTCDK